MNVKYFLNYKMLIPLFGNINNQSDWPKVISYDLIRHINNLKNKTHVISGQMKGRTQLPIPVGAEKMTDDDLKLAQRYADFIYLNFSINVPIRNLKIK